MNISINDITGRRSPSRSTHRMHSPATQAKKTRVQSDAAKFVLRFTPEQER